MGESTMDASQLAELLKKTGHHHHQATSKPTVSIPNGRCGTRATSRRICGIAQACCPRGAG